MHQHHVGIINLVVAAGITGATLFMNIFDNVSGFAGKVTPVIGMLVVSLQLYLLLRKFFRK